MKVEGVRLYDSNRNSLTGIAVGADLLDRPLAKTQVLLLLLLLLLPRVADIELPFLQSTTIPTASNNNFINIHLTFHKQSPNHPSSTDFPALQHQRIIFNITITRSSKRPPHRLPRQCPPLRCLCGNRRRRRVVEQF